MADLQKLQRLSAPHCVLLAVHYAAEANISALRALTALRAADLDVDLVLRLLLTYLPDSTDPSTYAEYLHELARDARSPGDDPAVSLDVSPVSQLSDTHARKKRRKLELLPLVHPLYRSETELDLLSHFLIHRAHNIDAGTGLLDLVPQLVVPFLNHSEYLRTWFISTVLPLIRLGYEYYPQTPAPSLEEFAWLRGRRAIELQLANLQQPQDRAESRANAARDLRGLVGPWICGANDRKRRKLSTDNRRASITEPRTQEPDDWECLFEWLVRTSRSDLPLVSAAICDWDGPEDLDLGGYDEGRVYVDEETQRKLELRYAQTAIACLYLVDDKGMEIMQTAHSLLTRVSDLLNLDPPPGLNVGTESLPYCDPNTPGLQHASASALQDEQITRQDSPLTQPDQNAVHLLKLLLFSTCVLYSLQNPLSIKEVARMYLRCDTSEQLSMLQKIVHTISSGAKRDAEQWKTIRAKLLWLWNWGAGPATDNRYARGVFGNLDNGTIETEILKGLLESGHYQLAIEIYIRTDQPPLPLNTVEKVVLTATLHHYDNASNGNRTRGGMKRASDIVSAFHPHFASSTRFERVRALFAATHAMSFYALTLQHGVPFQPVNIRVTADPLSLIRKLLQQNPRSYTHLDDLISIGKNLVVAMPSTLLDDNPEASYLDLASVEKRKAAAERRVIGMTVEAALKEDDFETAYSYVVTRLTPETPALSPAASPSSQRYSFGSFDSDKEDDEAEDVAWRAALQAGRHRSSPSSSMSWSQTGTATRPDLRRLEQRMELLSQALLLAPPRHLEEVLTVWQECEKQMTALLAEENEAEERFNDAADRRLPGAFATDTVAVQPRREVGRGAVEEAPMGLFDVARGAAAAFSKTAFPLRTGGSRASSGTQHKEGPSERSRVSLDLSDSGSTGGASEERVRKRDMVANAVTGGLASGIGWVLGAKPVTQQDRE